MKMNKKYKLITDDTKTTCDGITLYRIEALRDFADIKKGDKGGYIESEENLSHNGNAWVYENAEVYGDARVYENAKYVILVLKDGKFKLMVGKKKKDGNIVPTKNEYKGDAIRIQ